MKRIFRLFRQVQVLTSRASRGMSLRMQNQDNTHPEVEEVLDVVDATDEIANESAESAVIPEDEVAKWREIAARAVADLENYRNRIAREKSESIRFANQSLLEELLPVLDNFEMGMQAAAQDQGSMIYLGMSMVQKQIANFLENQGVQEIAALEKAFDPNLHEALSQEVNEEVAEGTVIRVMRKGYTIGERLLRPANVVVSTLSKESTESDA